MSYKKDARLTCTWFNYLQAVYFSGFLSSAGFFQNIVLKKNPLHRNGSCHKGTILQINYRRITAL